MNYTLPELPNSSGLTDLLVYESQQVPFLFTGILVFIYFVIAMSGYFSQERATGRGNLAMWMSIAGLITTTGGFILFLFDGLVNINVIIILMLVTILSVLWYFLAGD